MAESSGIMMDLDEDTTGSQELPEKRNTPSLPVNMCKTCESNRETPLVSDRDKWPIYRIEPSCFHQICVLLDLATKSNKPLMVALGGFSLTDIEHIETRCKEKGGVGIAKDILVQWGTRDKKSIVGALKNILKDIMLRFDVLDVIERWEKMSVCHGCGRKWTEDIDEEEYRRAYLKALEEGESKNNRIPIMVIGQDRAGKTSLMGRLLGLPFNKDQPSTIGIDVTVIELTEQNADDDWEKREVKEFMTSEDEAKTLIYKTTAQFVDGGIRRSSEEDAPEPLKPRTPVKPLTPLTLVKPLSPLTLVKPLSKEGMFKINSERSTQHNQKEVLRVFLNDLAGQSIFYDTHGCFLKPHCPYVLVHDLSLEFDDPAVPTFKASKEEEEEKINNPYCTTNLDIFESWLKLLQGLSECQDEDFQGEEFKLPPVLISLTHCDKVKGDDDKLRRVESRIGDVLSAGEYNNVFPELFQINNTLEGDEGDHIRKLRRKLFDLSNSILKQEKPMPLKWLNFEVALSKMISPDLKYIPVDEAKKEAENCGIQDFDQAIKFLHRLGAVVYHSGSSKVVLDPLWLMNLFTKVITIPKPEEVPPIYMHANDVFKKKGILFQGYLKKKAPLKHAELLEELMKKFNLISPGQHEGKPAFYVPSVAPFMMSGEQLEASTIPSLFVTFPRRLVPMSLFTKLQVRIISEWKQRFPKQQVTPSFYCNYSLIPLILDGNVYAVRLIDLHELIKVTVFPKQDGNHSTFVRHFLATLKKCLNDLKSPDQLLFSMTSYDLKVKCTCCFGKEERKCSRHDKIQCDSDRCGHRHFWKLSELQKLYEDGSPAVCQPLCGVFDINTVQIWLDTDTTGSEEPPEKRKKSPPPDNMCESCVSKDVTPLSTERDKWLIDKIEYSIFEEICKLLDLTDRSDRSLMSALGGFDLTTADCIEKKHKGEGGLGIAKDVLLKWGSKNKENNVGHFKKIVKDTMPRVDVLDVIEKWQKMSVCHGCGIRLNPQRF